jgi:hypothetical protein
VNFSGEKKDDDYKAPQRHLWEFGPVGMDQAVRIRAGWWFQNFPLTHIFQDGENMLKPPTREMTSWRIRDDFVVHSRFTKRGDLVSLGPHEMIRDVLAQVSYRIDHSITVGDLLKDACNYWGSWSQLVAETLGKGRCCQCVADEL